MDLVTILFVFVALAISLGYVFFFVDEVSDVEKHLNERWSEAAGQLGLTFTPFDGDTFHVGLTGELQGISVRIYPDSKTKVKKRSLASRILFDRKRTFLGRKRTYLEGEPVTIYQIKLNPLWPESVEISPMTESKQMFYQEAAISLDDPRVDERLLVTGVRREELRQRLSRDEIHSALLSVLDRYPTFKINAGLIEVSVPGYIVDIEELKSGAYHLVALAKVLNQAAIDASPYDDPRYRKSDQPAAVEIDGGQSW